MTTNTQVPTLGGPGAGTDGAAIPVYVARPEGAPHAAIIVIQEIFGVNKGIRKKTDDWAAAGYLAVAPDVFWRQEPGVELDADIPEQFQQGVGLIMKHDFEAGVRDIEAVIHWLKRDQGIAKVGLVGFCMGGRFAYMAATRTDIDASVAYYGTTIDQMLDERHAIARPLMLHIPTADGFVPPEVQQAVHEGLDDHPKVTIFDYVGLDHGFAATFGSRRVEDAATLADGRTAAFFAEHLA